MIEIHELKNRNKYLDKLIGFRDTEPVKVVTGIRRCGKSSLLKLMVQHLKNTGKRDEQIIEMSFESHDFKDMTSDEFYGYVKERIIPGKRMYLFFDELQRVDAWEEAVNSFRVDFDCDIYITGSNAYLLSSEYSTYLSGRCVEIKMLPLSFAEFMYFHGFELRETQSALGGSRKAAYDKAGEKYELREVFDAYMRFGGMPGIASIGNTLVNEGLLSDGKRKGTPSTHTVQAYVNALLESYFFYEIKRFDIKGKEVLRMLGKYYIVDIGLRNYLLGFRNRDSGHSLENVVYFELLRRGYDVAIGKIDNTEVDFIAVTANDKKYIQVTESMASEDVRERELRPLTKIRDNYEKIILSLDTGLNSSYDGIKSVNIIDWLLGNELY